MWNKISASFVLLYVSFARRQFIAIPYSVKEMDDIGVVMTTLNFGDVIHSGKKKVGLEGRIQAVRFQEVLRIF